MDEVLILLLRMGAYRKPVKLTTKELGTEVKMSQQNASRKLMALEEEGYLERSHEGLKLTKKTLEELGETYALLKQVFEEKIEISGKIVGGLGEGKYYMGLEGYRDQIKERLNLDPYIGTLNIKVEETWKREHLIALDPIVIRGFKDKERTYGDILAYPCKLEGHDCAIIVPMRTSHGPQIVEIICGFDIRKKLKKKDGDRIMVVL
jgi:riboflavin kinase